MFVKFLLIIDITILIVSINGFYIDVIQEKSLNYNGQKITENNLKDFLQNHERILFFGNNTNKKYTLVNVQHKNRQKRSNERIINFQIDDSGNNLRLKFEKSHNLLDTSFVFINRYENTSILIKDFEKLANKYDNCFYRNSFSAIDICEGTLRGILQNNLTKLFIQPLPKRFGDQSHIIFESINNTANDVQKNGDNENVTIDIILNDFEPKIDEFEPIKIINNNNDNNNNINNNGTDEEEMWNNFNNNSINNNYTNTPTIRYGAIKHHLNKRYIISGNRNLNGNAKIPKVLHIEIAIFVDKDLYKHMVKNYPKDTESNLIRFVLAMINGVQLLYHHPSLGFQINFVLKRLEILHSDPKELRRSSDIDIFLNSFCLWQKKFNPVSDLDSVHFDHAVILTGLDLYVVSKNGKISSQVVGLAPVAGMCTATSSCTINEGKHFESVFVVAHEIGHNLGMRHDTPENKCDPSLYIMSPTLGSGKITWSQCSRNYLRAFLETPQSRCLFDRGHFGSNLDHLAEGFLPGERFDANQQCMLKYGKDSTRSESQLLTEICRDLHCQRDRYTWTSHPALEGTHCGQNMWCKSGVCTLKSIVSDAYTSSLIPRHSSVLNNNAEKLNLIERLKYGTLKQEYNFNRLSMWSEWSTASECESGCLYGESGRLSEGSTGLKVYSRTCLDYRWTRKKCDGSDKKYEACSSKQCYSIPRTTILEFTNKICERAGKYDKDIQEKEAGIQEIKSNPEESCKVYCKTKSGKSKTKGWTYPDGTTCKNEDSEIDDTYYCVNGRCEKFTCENSSTNFFKIDSFYCPESLVLEESEQQQQQMIEEITPTSTNNKIVQENGRDYKSLSVKQAPIENEEMFTTESSSSSRRHLDIHEKRLMDENKSDKNYDNNWKIIKSSTMADDDDSTVGRIPTDNKSRHHHQSPIILNNRRVSNQWTIKSGCHFSCMDMSKGIQIISSNIDHSTNIQLCQPEIINCNVLQSTNDYSTKLCSKYQLKVRGLSGNGMQISPSIEDPDRSCKVACQDVYLRHRFYLVNGEQGYFPFGTKCSSNRNRYCVNGKCLEFGLDDIPLNESYISLALYRNKRDINNSNNNNNNYGKIKRKKRSFLYYNPINITERISQQLLDNIIANIGQINNNDYDKIIDIDQIDFNNPVHIPIEDDFSSISSIYY